MAHVGTLRDYEFASEAEDIRGSNLYGQNNEKLGIIDDVIFDHGTGEIRYVVAVADEWLDNRKFLVPGNRLSPSAEKEGDFYTPTSKEQVERLPAFDEKTLERNEDWAEYERKYSLVWEEEPVMRIKGTGRVLIPPQEAVDSDVGTAELRSPLGTPPQEASAKTSAAVRQRWQNFEEQLRNNREEILARCGVCNSQADRKREVA